MLDRLSHVWRSRSPERQRQLQAGQVKQKVEELVASGTRFAYDPELEQVFGVGVGALGKYLVYRMISHERGYKMLESWTVAGYMQGDPQMAKVEREYGGGRLILALGRFDQRSLQDFMGAHFSLEDTASYADRYQMENALQDGGWGNDKMGR